MSELNLEPPQSILPEWGQSPHTRIYQIPEDGIADPGDCLVACWYVWAPWMEIATEWYVVAHYDLRGSWLLPCVTPVPPPPESTDVLLAWPVADDGPPDLMRVPFGQPVVLIDAPTIRQPFEASTPDEGKRKVDDLLRRVDLGELSLAIGAATAWRYYLTGRMEDPEPEAPDAAV